MFNIQFSKVPLKGVLLMIVTAGSIVCAHCVRSATAKDGIFMCVAVKQQKPLGHNPTVNARTRASIVGILKRRFMPLTQGKARVEIGKDALFTVELPGFHDEKTARYLVDTVGRLAFRPIREVDELEWHTEVETINGRETGFERLIGCDHKPIPKEKLQKQVFDRDPIVTGARLKPNASADFVQRDVMVHFELKDDFKGLFENYTRGHIGKILAIFLDRKLISAPTIEDVIPGKSIIYGHFAIAQAKTLAILLNSGELPEPLRVVELKVVR